MFTLIISFVVGGDLNWGHSQPLIGSGYANDNGKAKPRLVTRNVENTIKMAEELGIPVIIWCGGAHPRQAKAFFEEMDEARHVQAEPNQWPGIIFVDKTDKRVLISIDDLNKSAATKIKNRWKGYNGPKEPID